MSKKKEVVETPSTRQELRAAAGIASAGRPPWIPADDNGKRSAESLVKIIRTVLDEKSSVLTVTDRRTLEGLLERKERGIEKYQALRSVGASADALKRPPVKNPRGPRAKKTETPE